MDDIHHECAIAAVFKKKKNGFCSTKSLLENKDTLTIMYKLLLNMQNRGQLSAGFSSYNNERTQLIKTYKQLGTVTEAFRLASKTKREKLDRKSTRLNSSHIPLSRMPSSA